jgi:hypothetical protein
MDMEDGGTRTFVGWPEWSGMYILALIQVVINVE